VRRRRFIDELGMSEEDAQTLTENRYLADYFEQTLAHAAHTKAVTNIILSEVLRALNERSIDIRAFPVSEERLAGLVQLRQDDKINSSEMAEGFEGMHEEANGAETLDKEMNLMVVSGSGFSEPIVDEVIEKHPDEVKRYRDGKKGLIGFFIGQVMQQSQGKANPKQVRELISERLNNE